MGVLRNEYNFRLVIPVVLGGQVRILHGKSKWLPKLAGEVNRVSGFRVCWVKKGRLVVKPGRLARLVDKLLR